MAHRDRAPRRAPARPFCGLIVARIGGPRMVDCRLGSVWAYVAPEERALKKGAGPEKRAL
jgi:hypothetical protein